MHEFQFLVWAQTTPVISALPLADPTFCTPGSIDVIVGSDQLWSLYTGERKYFGKDYPIALHTIFGWIIAGSYTACDDHITPAVTHHANLDTMVRSFMEMDNVQPNQSLLDSSDPTESHFANTHTRSEDGVYIVEYPFKDGALKTQNSKNNTRSFWMTTCNAVIWNN